MDKFKYCAYVYLYLSLSTVASLVWTNHSTNEDYPNVGEVDALVPSSCLNFLPLDVTGNKSAVSYSIVSELPVTGGFVVGGGTNGIHATVLNCNSSTIVQNKVNFYTVTVRASDLGSAVDIVLYVIVYNVLDPGMRCNSTRECKPSYVCDTNADLPSCTNAINFACSTNVSQCPTHATCSSGICECADAYTHMGELCYNFPNTNFLLVADIPGFHVIELQNDDFGDRLFNNLSHIATSVVALDYDYARGRVYFTDVGTQSIYSSTIDGQDIQMHIHENISIVDGLAIDADARLLFYTDAGNDIIRKYNIDNLADFQTIISSNLSDPRTIVLDPTNRMLYWTDWGTATIERATHDGLEREILINDFLYYPNGLTIDFIEGRMFWVDAGLDYIGSSNLDGTNISIAVTFTSIHGFGLELYHDLFIMSDWESRSVSFVWRNVSLGEHCGELITPDGTANGTATVYGTIRYLTCNAGYQLNGTGFIRCESDEPINT
ncbi:LRP6-like protein [Mya arenaria]|uniref:LRP6-like protein n=1 Tax=Mya arenaria TaxID=6604 RepID=A0ABY7FLY7_MYAAR|nr:LRP6-like protein [Mya arenaria]